MTCQKCADIIERPDLPHVVRICEGCGRSLHIHETGKHGIGVQIHKGDQFVIPAGWLKFSLDPRKSSGQFYKGGLQWYAEQIHLDGLPNKKDNIEDEVIKLQQLNEEILNESVLLQGLNINNSEHGDKIFDILNNQKTSLEWWVYLAAMFYDWVLSSIENNDIKQAVWAMGCAERCRSMQVYKEHLEEVVWMGHSAKRVIDMLRIWDNNKLNEDEGFWQITLKQNAYAISQIFAVPLLFIKDSAYVGGMNIDRKSAKFVDYLFALESSREAVLVEIKTPVTKLLGTKYRGTYRPSQELTGSLMQVLDYRDTLMKDLRRVTEGTNYTLNAFSPKCVVIVGNGAAELADEEKRTAFELFRANSKDVEIVTYDELFRKLDILANLFSLTRSS